MKALTVYEPWATLMAIEAKRIETRSWATKYRGPLAIQAGMTKKFVKREIFTRLCQKCLCLLHQRMTFGAVVAIVVLTDCVKITYPIFQPDRKYDPYRILARNEADFGNYSVGRYMWFTQFQKRIDPPIPVRGAMGLWEWNCEVELKRR